MITITMSDDQIRELNLFVNQYHTNDDIFSYIDKKGMQYEEMIHFLSALKIVEDEAAKVQKEALRRHGE